MTSMPATIIDISLNHIQAKGGAPMKSERKNFFQMFIAWLKFKLDRSMYCPRCGGCGYVDCCGVRCDGKIFCAKYYYPDEQVKP
jgi:hypothetical protein